MLSDFAILFMLTAEWPSLSGFTNDPWAPEVLICGPLFLDPTTKLVSEGFVAVALSGSI